MHFVLQRSNQRESPMLHSYDSSIHKSFKRPRIYIGRQLDGQYVGVDVTRNPAMDGSDCKRKALSVLLLFA